MSEATRADDDDRVLEQVLAAAVATFPKVFLTGTLARRLGTAINATRTNKVIYSEGANGVLLAVVFTTASPFPVWLTQTGKLRIEQEAALSPGK